MPSGDSTAKRVEEAKKKVIRHLAKGKSWAEATRLAGWSMSAGYYHRKQDTRFERDCVALLHGRGHREQADDLTDDSQPWERFMVVFKNTRSRSEALDASGLSASQVEEMLDPESDKSNEAFISAYQDWEKEVAWEVEDTAMRMAVTDRNPAMVKRLLDGKPGESRPALTAGGDINFIQLFSDGDRAKRVLDEIGGDPIDITAYEPRRLQ